MPSAGNPVGIDRVSAGAATLERRISLTQLVLYGLGTTVGAGIYVLIGEVAGAAGFLTPLAFILASLLAGFSALSFGELAARFPQSAGEAIYVAKGFAVPSLATAVGLLVVTAGCVSSATMAHGFVGYLGEFVSWPRFPVMLGLVAALTAVAIWGIGESVTLAGLITLLEVGGLLLIIGVSIDNVSTAEARPALLLSARDPATARGVLVGAVLAFYAFLGFEDIVNVAEETTNAPVAVPLAIGATLALTTLIYVAVACVSVLSVDPQELASSDAPLAMLYERNAGGSAVGIGVVGLLAVLNGALIQIIMASRVLFGLTQQGALPAWFGRIQPRTRTPANATLAVGGAVVVLAIGFPLTRLAEATSMVTLLVFASVNAALWRIQVRDGPATTGFSAPSWVPPIGAFVSASLFVYRLGLGWLD